MKGADMRIALDAAPKRPAAVLKALMRGEKVTLKYKDQEVAVIAEPTAESEYERLLRHPAFGMWADRRDMEDVETWRSAQYRKLGSN